MDIRRLKSGDEALARETFSVMAAVFEEPHSELSIEYVRALLARPDFWAMTALHEGEVVGGITGHVLPMTRAESSELFIYDLAVRVDRQRRGVGRALVTHLRDAVAAEGIRVAFVPADDEDEHALDFYRALGAAESPVTLFVFDDQ